MSDTKADAPAKSTAIAKRLIDGRSAVSQPAISPDGTHVAYVVGTTDLENNTGKSIVWLDDAPITAGDHDGNPTWSPDGRHLAFTSRRGEKKGDSTLHIIPVGGPGEVRTICTMADGLGDVSWSPDGKTIAFTSRTRDERYEAKDASWQAPRKIERFFSRLNGEDWIFDRPQHIYMVAADGTGVPVNLTPGEFQHSGISWLPDSSGVITSGQRQETWDTDHAQNLYFVPALAESSDDIRCLTGSDAAYYVPSVSPDGTQVAFIGYEDLTVFPQNPKVGVLSIDSNEVPHTNVVWASADLDRTFMCTVGMRAPIWEDDKHLLATAEDRGDTHLYRIHAAGSQAPVQITTGSITVQTFDAAADQIATIEMTSVQPPELFIDGQRQTFVTEEFSKGLLPWEKYTVPTADGTNEIDCWVMRPADFDESKTYPVLLNVHGGPFTQYGEYFFDEAQMQAAAGFVVLMGNPRGGSGRENAWGQAILGTRHPKGPGSGWGGLDADDCMSILTESLKLFSFCDPGRVGMLGGSYGGFMATWLAGHHGEHFRAFCSERSVNNLESEEWNSDIATIFRTEHGPSHIEDRMAYVDHSPIKAVRNIDKPMLLIHSEEDYRCPMVQAEELWVALKLLGKEVDFYRFPGENHELSRSGSPIHRVQRAEIILDWFAEKLA